MSLSAACVTDSYTKKALEGLIISDFAYSEECVRVYGVSKDMTCTTVISLDTA